jgi:putative ABC transport system permease protein
MLSQLRARLRGLVRRTSIEAELSEELRSHLDREIDRNRASGMSVADATAAAHRAFGNVELVRESARESWTWRALDDLMRDLRFAFRYLRRAPVLHAVVIAVLALGIGANAAVYTVFRGFAVRTIAVPQPEQLFRVVGGEASPGGKVTFAQRMSVPDYLDIRERLSSAKEVAAFVTLRAQMQIDASKRTVDAAFVSGNYFSTLRVRPLLGRLLLADEEGPAGAHPVAVISEVIWRSEFGKRPDILGRSIVLGATTLTIVGVVPQSFVGTAPEPLDRVWVPFAMYDAISGESGLLRARDFSTASVFRRDATGGSRARIQSQLTTLASSLNQEAPTTHQRFHLEVRDGSRLVSAEDAAQPLRTLGLVWALLLIVHLIACSNVGSLLLSRAIARRPEMATRLALGASRWQIVRQLLVESVALSGIAVVLGIGIALLALRVVATIPFLSAFDFHVDAPVLAVAAGVGAATALLFGLTPALEAARTDILGSLTGSTTARSRKRGQSPAAFVGAQLALSVALLATTALAVRVTSRAANSDPGYDVEHLLFVYIELSDSAGTGFDPGRYAVAYDVLRSGIAALPGVRSVSAAQDIPLTPTQMRNVLTVPGYSYGPDETHYIGLDNVAPGFFSTMGIPVLRGHDFDGAGYGAGWHDDGLRSIVVNDAFARHFWPGKDPIGRQVLLGGRYAAEIVGVVRDVRDQSLLNAALPRYYISLAESMFTLIVRTDVPTEPVASMVRRRIGTLGISLARPPQIRLGESIMAQSLQVVRTTSRALALMSVLALGLASLGLYGLVSFTMQRQTREIGVRLALGARSRDIYELASGVTLRPALAGIVIGMAAAFAIVRFANSVVAGIGDVDVGILLVTTAVLVLVIAGSVLIPARRALRIDPMRALRQE